MKYETYLCMGEEITIPVAESYKDCILLARSDIYRYHGRKVSFWRMLRYHNCLYKFDFWFRMASYPGCLRKFCGHRYKRISRKLGITLPARTKVGYGLYIGHGIGLIVNGSAIIGNNCNLSQTTTIGSNRGKAAIIGNKVYLAPHVCLVEDVEIGSGCCIGAGAVVTKNIPPQKTAAGVPAKIIADRGCQVLNTWEV